MDHPSHQQETFPDRRKPASAGTVNLNSVLLTVVLALSGWTLATVNAQARDAASAQVKTETNSRDLVDLRLRVTAVENQVQQTRIELAALEARIAVSSK